jgi:uncharacterized membrane protein
MLNFIQKILNFLSAVWTIWAIIRLIILAIFLYGIFGLWMFQESGFSINKVAYLFGVTLFFVITIWWTWFYDESKVNHKKDNPVEEDDSSVEDFQNPKKKS